jgi:tetratricopeptide (TPR) repeat protein
LNSLELQSTALNALTMTLFFSHRLDEMLARANEALEVAEQAGSEKLKVDTIFLMGLKHCCYGDLKEAKVCLDEAIATSRRLNHKPGLCSGLTWRACLHFFQTEYELATTAIDEAMQLASELRDGFLLLTCFFFRGLSQGNQGKMSAALATLNEALEKARRNGDLFWHPRFPNCIGWIYRELYDFESAHKYNEDGIEVSRRHHVLEAEANSLINRGIDCTHAGAHQETAAAFHEVKDIFERDAWFRWRYNIRFEAAMAEHWLSQGDVGRAREFVDRLRATATEHEVHKYIAVAHQLMAKIAIANGDLTEAEKHFDAALDELANYPAPLVTWKVHAGRAHLKSQMGDVAGAQESSAHAKEIVTFIAANVNDEKLRATFLKAASTDYTESA